jgi:hypothetical protein
VVFGKGLELRMITEVLRFSDLSKRHTGVSEGIASSYSEAERVCLDRHHVSPVEFRLRDGDGEGVGSAEWAVTDKRVKNAWANKDDATEAGAYGVALAAVEVTRGLVALRRAETRSGADYYLGPTNGNLEDLETSFRFEVSGTDEGSASVIDGRPRRKLDQARKGISNVPAIASVVGFALLQVVSSDVDTR